MPVFLGWRGVGEHSAIIRAMKPMIGVRFAGRDKLVHLIGLGEVVPRLGRGIADRFHRAAHTGEGITNRNQPVSFVLHGFYSPIFPRHTPRQPKVSRRISVHYLPLVSV